MKKITVEKKFYLKCDKCRKVFDEETPNIVLKVNSFSGFDKSNVDDYYHMDSELSFCQPCGQELWSQFLRILTKEG